MKICTLIHINELDDCTATINAVLNQAKSRDNIYICGNVTEKLKRRYSQQGIVFMEKSETIEKAFEKAFACIIKKDYEWVWCLRAPVVPDQNTLNQLALNAQAFPNASFFSSVVKSADNTIIFRPTISKFEINGAPSWPEHYDSGLVRIGATAIHSILIRVAAIKVVGAPTENSIGQDQTKYTSLFAAKYGAGYYVGSSHVRFYGTKVVVPIVKAPVVVKESKNICAIVVTYNRKTLLVECINALLNQTNKSFDILIIDNASTDGTKETIEEKFGDKIKYFNTGSNAGGAGGFYYGFKIAYERGYDWLWIMDDDVIPSPTALAELLVPTKQIKNASFFASAVYSPKGEAMNTPEISNYSVNGYKFWYVHLDKGLMRLAHATFVSLLINRNAIEKCGLPCKDYFIWGDDTEYTMRIIGKYAPAYMVGKSKVVHKRESSSALSIYKENNPNRIKMYYYLMRNTLINSKTYFGDKSNKGFLKRYKKDAIKIALNGSGNRLIKIKTIFKAISDYKHERYDKAAFYNRYLVYGQERVVATVVNNDVDFVAPQFCTVRNVKISPFLSTNYVESALSDNLIKKQCSNIMDASFLGLSLLCPNEKLVLNLDSFVYKLKQIVYKGKKYYFDLSTEISVDFLQNEDVSFSEISSVDLDKEYVEDRILELLNNILTKYKHQNIVLISPKNESANYFYNYIKSKAPYCQVVDSLDKLF